MNTKKDYRSQKVGICSIGSVNTSATREPVYSSSVRTIMENPFQKLSEDINEIKMMLAVLLENQHKPVEKSDLLCLDEATEMLHLSKSSIYKMSMQNKIPVIKRLGSNRLLFSRANLEAWLKESTSCTLSKRDLVDDFIHRKMII